MFFFFSKILSFLTASITWIFLCFVFYLVFKQHKWRIKVLKVGIVAFLILSNPWLGTRIFQAWEVDPTPLTETKKHDIAVVFSGMTMNDYEPKDRIYFNKASDRIMMAVHLYKIGKVDKILISGGYGTLGDYGDVEAETLERFLLMLEIPKTDIIKEAKAKNTYQNALFTKELIDAQYPDATCLLITSAFHMRRSYGCAQKVGLECTPFSVDFHTKAKFHRIDEYIMPRSSAIFNWDILFHEWVGYIVYAMTGKL